MSAYEKVRTGKLVLKGEKSRLTVYISSLLSFFWKFNTLYLFFQIEKTKVQKTSKRTRCKCGG